MVRTAVATLQTPWDCRWSRLGYRVAGVPEDVQPEPLWVCLGTGDRRCIQVEECDNCPHWVAESRTLH